MGLDSAPVGGDDKIDTNEQQQQQQNNNHRNRNNRRGKSNNRYTSSTNFTGLSSELNALTLQSTGTDQVAELNRFLKRLVGYAGKYYGSGVAQSIESLTLVLPGKPSKPKAEDGTEKTTLDEIEMAEYKLEFQEWLKQKEKVKEGLRSLFYTVYNQLHDGITELLLEDDKFSTIKANMDVIGLLKMLQALSFDGDVTSDPFYSMLQAITAVITLKQNKHQSLEEYHKKFGETKKAADETLGGDNALLDAFANEYVKVIAKENDEDVTKLSDDEKKSYQKQGRERMEAMLFLINADRSRYGHAVDDLKKDFIQGTKYPADLPTAYALLRAIKPRGKGTPNVPNEVGHSFNTNGDEGGGKNEGGGKKDPCGRCGRKGHSATECFSKTHQDGTLLHVMGEHSNVEVEEYDVDKEGVEVSSDELFASRIDQYSELMFHQSDLNSTSSSSNGIPESWILLDSQSSIDIFCNRKLLTRIYKSNSILTIRCNAGVRRTQLRGHLSGYGWVWYFPDGIANILSLSRVKERYRVTYDSASGNCFQVHKTTGEILNFREAQRRLYYFDTNNRDTEETLLVNTVANNLKLFSALDVSKAKLARELQRKVGRPSTADFIRYMKENQIRNCPVTPQDVRNAEFIWGPDIGSLQGKTTWTKPSPIRIQQTEIPPQIMDHYRDVTLSADIMKVTGIPFLTTISRHIKFGSAGKLDSMENKSILPHFKAIISAYAIRGFRVTIVLADGQFESMRTEIADLHVRLHIVARDEHVPEIERYNRTIKERVRASYNSMPFEHVPPIMIIEMVYSSVFWRNMFALLTGISTTQSPGEIVLNRKLDYNLHCGVELFEYVHTHEEHDNSMAPRTLGAIATRPTGDGSYKFISLTTGRVINRRSFTKLPLNQLAIDQMHRLARRAKAATELTFTNRDNVDLDTLYADLDRDADDLPLEEVELAGVDNNDGDDYEDNNAESDDDDDEDYNPSDDDSSGDESESSDDSSEDDDDDEDREIPGVGIVARFGTTNNDNAIAATDDDESQDDETGETPGVDDETGETPGVGNIQAGETPGVENDGDTPGVGDHSALADDMETPGVDNHNEMADDIETGPTTEPGQNTDDTAESCDNGNVSRSGRIRRPNSLYPTSEYVHTTISNGKVQVMNPRMFSKGALERVTGGDANTATLNTETDFNMTDTYRELLQRNEQILLLNVDEADDNGYSESIMAETDAEWVFLTDYLGWKEGLQGNTWDIDNEPEYLFTTDQMGWKQGLKVFGEKGEEAIQKELQQIHDMEGFQPKHWYELSKEERADALKYLMYLKEKRDGRIKGRGCADGRKQRAYIPKAEASSPTATLSGIMLTCMIDAFEKRDVATVDIPGAFIQTKMPEEDRDVHVVLDGRMAELLAKISPDDYQTYVHQHRGQSHIYCKLNVALYGTLKGAVLFWKKLSSYLKGQGFIINPYDWCVANKNINGKQCTIVWHVDDLKISHVDSKVVDGIISALKDEFGKVADLTVKRGKIHDYLGMTLDFSSENSVMIDMEKYIDEILADLPDDMDGTAVTPAADYLFRTRDDVAKLDDEKAALFHRVTAQLLFASQRARPDLRTAVSFLTKRVKSPDEDDYKKLVRAIKYVRRTKFLRLKIEANRLDMNHWFIDGAFAVHADMKSHTGAYMTFGKGMVNGMSAAQKINTTSSTEAEVVAVHDNMPAILWTRYFMEAQGYPLKPTVIHQDNQSAMLLETNGIGSSSKRTRHMNIRYFFVADVQERKQITLEYCPTDEMIGDFFTKPLGGAKFRRFRNIIMNIEHDEYGPVDIDDLMAIHHEKMTQQIEMKDSNTDAKDSNDKSTQPMASQECVGNRTDGRVSATAPTRTYAEVVKQSSKHTTAAT